MEIVFETYYLFYLMVFYLHTINTWKIKLMLIIFFHQYFYWRI